MSSHNTEHAPQSAGSAADSSTSTTLSTPARKPAHPGPAYYVLALVPSTLILLAGLILPLIWRSEMPDTVPTHWGSNGPDAFGSFTSGFIAPIAIMFGVVLFVTALIALIGRDASTQRVGIVVTTAIAGLGSTITIVSGHQARGATDPASINLPGLGMTVGIVIGLALGVLFAFLLPAPHYGNATALPEASAPRANLGELETAVWFTRVYSRASLYSGAFAVIVIITIALVAKTYFVLVVGAFLAVLLLAMFVWNARVDASGFTIRSSLGIPSKHVPLAEIESAQVITVSPFTDFGGWGWRTSLSGAVGIVLRKGEALEILMSGDRTLVVTLDDAATAAGLLNTLVERSR